LIAKESFVHFWADSSGSEKKQRGGQGKRKINQKEVDRQTARNAAQGNADSITKKPKPGMSSGGIGKGWEEQRQSL